MPFKFLSVETLPEEGFSLLPYYSHKIFFETTEDLNACLEIINKRRKGTELRLMEAKNQKLELTLLKYDFWMLNGSEQLQRAILDLKRNFEKAITFVKNENPSIQIAKDPKKLELIKQFDSLLLEVDNTMEGKAFMDRLTLYKVLELNYELFLALYPGSDERRVDTPNDQTICDRFQAVKSFYDKHSNLMVGREPSRLGKIFSIVGIIVGVAALIVGSIVAPPLAAAGLLLGAGIFGLHRSQGTGLKKQQIELMDEVSQEHTIALD